MGVRLHEASAVEVQFGIMHAEQLDVRRNVCRIQRDGRVWLASRATDAGDLQPRDTASTRTIDPERYYSVTVERTGRIWRVTFDGQQVGELPVDNFPYRSEFRLVTKDGRARFSDLEVEDLEPEGATP